MTAAVDEKIFNAVKQRADDLNETLIIRVCRTIFSNNDCRYCEMKLNYVLAKLCLHRCKREVRDSYWTRNLENRLKLMRVARFDAEDMKARMLCYPCTCDGSLWKIIGSRFTFLPFRRRP